MERKLRTGIEAPGAGQQTPEIQMNKQGAFECVFFAHARTKQKEHRTEDVRTVAGDDVQIFEQMIAARSNSLLQWDSSKSSGTAPGHDKISDRGCVYF